jgi:hypothetical protein
MLRLFTPPVDKKYDPKNGRRDPQKATGRYMLCAVLSTASEVYRHEAYLA